MKQKEYEKKMVECCIRSALDVMRLNLTDVDINWEDDSCVVTGKIKK